MRTTTIRRVYTCGYADNEGRKQDQAGIIFSVKLTTHRSMQVTVRPGNEAS